MYFTTVDLHRTHIASSNGNYIGNVNSYNNFLTRFVAKLFRLSILINFGHKTIALNTKSYTHLLNRLGLKDLNPNFAINAPSDQSYMKAHLSKGKVRHLTKGLIRAIQKKNLPLATQYVGQGANVNCPFTDYGIYGIRLKGSDHPPLPIENIKPFSIRTFTPVTLAIKNNFLELQGFMKSVGGTTDFIGSISTFSRILKRDVRTLNGLGIESLTKVFQDTRTFTHESKIDSTDQKYIEIALSKPNEVVMTQPLTHKRGWWH